MSTAATDKWAGIAGPDTPAAVRTLLVDGHPGQIEQLQDEHARPTKPSEGDSHANDPSRTTTIQRQYAQKLRGRFEDIRAEIRQGVGERDALGLDEDGSALDITEVLGATLETFREAYYEYLGEERYDAARTLIEQFADFDPVDLSPRDFEFTRDAEKHEAFMRWLRTQQDDGVLDVISRGDNQYVRAAYERGWENANTWLDDDPIEDDVGLALNRPVHADKLSLLYERNFEALQGITDDVAREISRELAEGMAEGVGPEETARRLADRVDKIGRTRATNLARTETMYAHNEATLTTYERISDEMEVEVLSEVSTAGDDNVCEICDPQDGRQFSIDDARSDGPPFHPQCRCVLMPASNRNERAVARARASAQAAA